MYAQIRVALVVCFSINVLIYTFVKVLYIHVMQYQNCPA